MMCGHGHAEVSISDVGECEEVQWVWSVAVVTVWIPHCLSQVPSIQCVVAITHTRRQNVSDGLIEGVSIGHAHFNEGNT